MQQGHLIKYPRRTIIRRILKGFASLLVGLLIRIEVKGSENFPKSGPFIVVGNHVSSLEPILMLILVPQQLEYLGSGDIPIDPKMSFITSLYQFIPIMRGQIDQKGLGEALKVLSQNGVLGIFPEGGIWEKSLKEPKLGTSWIAHKSKAPVLPIGFVGMNDAMQKALSLQRPKITVNIGKLVLYEELFSEDLSLRLSTGKGATKIMEKISDLLPLEEITNPELTPQRNLIFISIDKSGKNKKLIFYFLEDLSKLIEHPVIMDVFKRNLKLPVKFLMVRNQPIKVDQLVIGLSAIKNYLESNPGFLSYRFGIDQSIKMKAGIENLLQYIEENDSDVQQIVIKYKLVEH